MEEMEEEIEKVEKEEIDYEYYDYILHDYILDAWDYPYQGQEWGF